MDKMDKSITFLGAAQNVTGSRYLVQAGNLRVLVDCGLHQERALRRRDFEPFPVEPGTISAVLLTHAHLDHCGYLPKLVREGFRGKVYCTGATAEVARIVLLDSAHIQEEDAKYKMKRHRKEGRESPRGYSPLYTVADAEAALPHFRPVKLRERVPLGEGVAATFHNAGHILGASFIEIDVRTGPPPGGQAPGLPARGGLRPTPIMSGGALTTHAPPISAPAEIGGAGRMAEPLITAAHRRSDGSGSRSVVFSGDVGREHKPIIRDPVRFDEADYVVIESTYGDRDHGDAPDIPTEFARVVNEAVRRGGNVLVPSFSVERAHEVLYHINNLMREKRVPKLMTFLDSPMAVRVTEVFERHPELFDAEMVELVRKGESPFEFPQLHLTRTVEESKAINRIRGTAIIIAGSGMCTGGRIKHHLKNHMGRPESTILFVGYQAVGTLGRSIVDGNERVRIFGQKREVRAAVERIRGFSAHADRHELVEWITSLKKAPRRVFVTHGDREATATFVDLLGKKTGWDVRAPAYRDECELE